MVQSFSRRNFLAAIAVGIGAFANTKYSVLFGEEHNSAWVNDMRINKIIDNLRVVNCTDPKMIKGDPKNWDIVSQNAPVIAERVQADMDDMACALAQKSSSFEAWGSIFQKSQAKNWSQVKVAIKPNGSGNNNTRVAVINAVCNALISLGVQQNNIILYGSSQVVKDEVAIYHPFLGKGLPAGIILSNGHNALGGIVKTTIPKPCEGLFDCPAALANGSIDILVNIATNKGHFLNSLGGLL